MRVVRVFTGEDVRYGLADGTSITLISDEPFAAWETEDVVALGGARLMPPAMPTKIVCVGVNYRSHAAEMGHDAAERAAHLPQAAHVDERADGRDPHAPRGRRASTTRASSPS